MLSSLLLALSLQLSGDTPPNLVWPAKHPDAVLGEQSSNTLSRQTVEIDYGILFTKELGGSDSFQLELNPETTVVVDFAKREQAPSGFCWIGTLREDANGSAIFSVVENRVMASVVFQDRLFRIAYAGGELHYVAELDSSAFPACGTTAAHAISLPPEALGRSHSTGGNPNVDVMVAYTTQAKNAQGGTNALLSLINLAFTETNQGYVNSDVNQRVVLVHTQEEVGYTEAGQGFSLELERLRKRNDGHMDDVHASRNLYKADCVALLVAPGTTCGVAYLMTEPSSDFSKKAVSVTAIDCATGYYSFGHELGHNMGSAHDHGNADEGAYDYSFGWRTSGWPQYRTIMAYAPGQRVNKWSNPNITHNGRVMGQTDYAENWRSLNDTASIVAGWREGGFSLAVTGLTAGQSATLSLSGADADAPCIIAYSLAGSGPTSTQLGDVDLSMPITRLPNVVADTAGSASLSANIPVRASGLNVWIQAADLSAGVLSNALAEVVG